MSAVLPPDGAALLLWIMAFVAILLPVSAVPGRRGMARTALALLVNLGLHIFTDASGVAGILVGFLCAFAILTRPAGRMQALIGWTLLAQIFIDSGYWAHLLVGGYSPSAEQRYLGLLAFAAGGQLLLLGAWVADGVARYRWGLAYIGAAPWHRARARADDRESLA